MARQNLLRSRAGPKIAVDPAQVARVVEEVFPEALGVWIFGSYAQGRARRDSDLDIAILPDRPIDAWQRIERAQDVAVGVHREVDLVDPSTERLLMDAVLVRKTASLERCVARVRNKFLGHEAELDTDIDLQDIIVLNL